MQNRTNEELKNNWDLLPDEVKLRVFSFFSRRELAPVNHVNKEWYGLAHDNGLQKNIEIDYQFFVPKILDIPGDKIVYIKAVDALIFWHHSIMLFKYDLIKNETSTFLILEQDYKVKDVIELSNDRILIHYESHRLEIYDLKTQECVHACLQPLQHMGPPHKIHCIAELSDGRIIYADSAGPVYIWDLQTQVVTQLSASEQIYAAAIAPLSDNRVVTGTFMAGGEGYLTVWYLSQETNNTVSEIWSMAQITDVIAMPGCLIAAPYTDDKWAISFYDQTTGKLEDEKEIDYRVQQLVKISDDNFVVKASRGHDRFVEFWSLAERKCLSSIKVINDSKDFNEKVIPLPDGKVMVGNKLLQFKVVVPALEFASKKEEQRTCPRV